MNFLKNIISKFQNRRASKDVKKIISEIIIIKNISKTGFDIYDLDDNLKNGYKWRNIKSVKFSENYKDLQLICIVSPRCLFFSGLLFEVKP